MPLDIWALGVSLYIMIFDALPFPGPDMDKQIKENEVQFPADVEVSDDLINLIKALLEKDPEKRPNIEQVFENHPWLHVQPGFEIEN
jgi:serine/threonine protein kinase